MAPTSIAVCSGSCVVAANVMSIATAESGAVRSTSLMSSQRPVTNSIPITRISPPMTGMGISSANDPATKTSAASQIPAKMPAHRVCAPAETATPVRDSDPPVGSAPKKPPAKLAAPWATKSLFVFGRVPSGFGTAAEMPAAWASPTSATASRLSVAAAWRRNWESLTVAAHSGWMRCADGLDVNRTDDDSYGHHHQRDERREGLQRLDEVKHRPYRDGGHGDQTRAELP